MLDRLKAWAKTLKRDAVMLWLAARDPRTPVAAKVLAAVVAAYALSPIDLIPDFIPVLGYLDDLLIVPAGVWLTLRLIPEALKAELRAEAERLAARPKSRGTAAVIVALWVAGAVVVAWWAWRLVRA